MNTYDHIALKIIKEQEAIMGSVAWEQAGQVKGLHVLDRKAGTIAMEDGANGRVVIDELVGKFGHLFGRAGREVCREAVTALIADLPPSEVPSSLRE